MLIDKEKTQIDAATERMMTWTEDLEEESVVEVEEKDETDEDQEEAGDEDVDGDVSDGFDPCNE